MTASPPNTTSLQQLNDEFSLQVADNKLHFIVGNGDMPFVEIYNQHASALISLQGAHILSWIPKGEEDVLWVS